MSSSSSFAALGLSQTLCSTLSDLNYETPSPIQEQGIPVMLSGTDLIGMAQTGTGKTAAFALPAIQMLEEKQPSPQVLVLAPTRELALQVGEAFSRYTRNAPNKIRVASLVGGQGFDTQLRQLKSNPHIVVGTPGRVMDHMRRGKLNIESLRQLILDEADEMLRMGFIEDVEWVLSHTPEDRQIALFSATMPKEIERLAKTYLHEPELVKIKSENRTASTVEQFIWHVDHTPKPDALIRILEFEQADAVIVFTRTRTETMTLAERLEKEGFKAAALNGDLSQAQRERTLNALRKGQLDILIATDVAARGLDVDRIELVVNYDMPFDSEAYIHRIGRTGRAGKSGKAILFARYRERRLLKNLVRTTGKELTSMMLPSVQELHQRRLARFSQQLLERTAEDGLPKHCELVKQLQEELELPMTLVAASLLKLATGDSLLTPKAEDFEQKPRKPRRDKGGSDDRRDGRPPRKRRSPNFKGKKRSNAQSRDGKPFNKPRKPKKHDA